MYVHLSRGEGGLGTEEQVLVERVHFENPLQAAQQWNYWVWGVGEEGAVHRARRGGLKVGPLVSTCFLIDGPCAVVPSTASPCREGSQERKAQPRDKASCV